MENPLDKYPNLSREQLFEILENIYNEVYVVDKNMDIIYVNSTCVRNYGLLQEEMIGKNHNDFTGGVWFPSVMPKVFKEKRAMTVEHVTDMGKKTLSIAVPVLDEDKCIEMVVCITEEEFESLDVKYNPQDNIIDYSNENADLDNDDYEDIIATSRIMKNLLKIAKRSAKRDIPVLIQGESGTGKSMLAKYIHDNSLRKTSFFMSINCATISESLLESELFGYAPYAFTGANSKGKIGLIEAADGGTLFLDEIGELALPLQAKLLDVIENKKFIPVGGKEVKYVDVRIISATNQNLQEMIENKTFREDLYWRINGVDLKIPPLKNRYEDIEIFIGEFLKKFNIKYEVNKEFSKEALDIMINYEWPGNIRQLKNTIERTIIISSEDVMGIEDLPENILNDIEKNKNGFYDYKTFEDICTKQIIVDAYETCKSSRKVAEALEISQSTANRLIRKYIATT